MNELNKPDPLQAAAPTQNAVVKASAGVGKTYLLVTRLIRLLLGGARAEGILAITFTRKAAAEMQERLAARLYALSAADDEKRDELLSAMGLRPDPALRQRAAELYEQLMRQRGQVRTTTFHAFCQEILRRFPMEADVPPGFTLLEKTENLADGAWEALYAEATREPEGELAQALETMLQASGSLGSTHTALMGFLHHRGDWWAFSRGHDRPQAQAERQLAGLLEYDAEADAYAELMSPVVSQDCQELAELLRRHPTQANAGHAEQIALAAAAEGEARFALMWPVFYTGSGKPRSRKHSKTLEQKLGGDGAARLLELHELYVARLARVEEMLRRRRAYELGCAWYFAGARLLDCFQRLKQEQRALDFTDLEWRAYLLLSHGDNAQWVQYKLDERIDHLLVDEFQDTNPVQWRLLLPLLEELAAGGREGRSAFLVGDDKQSIYGFRRADPRLLDEAGQWLQQHLGARDFPMDKSRRSAAVIMQVVNNTFQHEAAAGLLPHFTPHDTFHRQLHGRAELWPLISHEEEVATAPTLRNPLEQPRRLLLDQRHFHEGQQIARKINALIDEACLIGEGEQARPLRYGDIMLLVRSRSHLSHYERALREAGIPYLSADRGTLLESAEVQDMVNLLEVLTTPFNNLALAAVLRSPIFACDDDLLIRLAQTGEGHWRGRLTTLAEAEPEGEAAQIHRRLQRWQHWAGFLPIHDLLDHIYTEAEIPARYEAAFPAHMRSRARANLTRLLELALEIDSGRYPSLGRFLARLEELRQYQNEAPDEANPEQSDDAVRILTIHGSKGLEAPVVFLADTTPAKAPGRAFKPLVDWPAEAERPTAFVLPGRKAELPTAYADLLEEAERREHQESANLLYVAITRARQMLFVSGVEPSGKELGWYGWLAAGWPKEGEQALVLESGVAPAQAGATPPPATVALETDPRLRAPLVTAGGEILATAPHRTVGDFADSEFQGEQGRLRGRLIHRLLELLSEQTATAPALRQACAELGLDTDADLAREALAEAGRTLEDARLRPYFEPDAETQAFNEMAINTRLEGKLVQGQIDRLLVRPQEVLVIDYKTHRLGRDSNLAALAEAYRPQLALYVAAVRRIWPGRRVRAMVLFTQCAEMYEFDAAD